MIQKTNLLDPPARSNRNASGTWRFQDMVSRDAGTGSRDKSKQKQIERLGERT